MIAVSTRRRRSATNCAPQYRPTPPKDRQAKAAVDAFLANVQQSDDKVRAAIAGLPENAGVAEIVAALSGLATNIQQTIDSGRTLVTNIQQLSSALKDGFENADSCQQLREQHVKPAWEFRRRATDTGGRGVCQASRRRPRSSLARPASVSGVAFDG